MNKIFLSFVITSYNRIDILPFSIQSILDQHQIYDKKSEIIIVDDASSDGTFNYLASNYREQIEKNIITLKRLEKNIGVTGAKNAGYEVAEGRWVIFLDSDDRLAPGVFSEVENVLLKNAESPIVFFRCINEDGELIGNKFDAEKKLDINEYLEYSSYGEALTAVNKKLIKGTLPYPAELRGYEGLGCSRIIIRYGAAVLSTIIARIYVQNRYDRLSINKGFLRRLLLLAKGHMLMFKEFKKIMCWRLKIAYLTKAILYKVMGYVYQIIGGKA